VKTNQPLTFDNDVQTADCYLLRLADGTAILMTNCDRPLTAPTAIEWSTVEKYGANTTARFASRRIQRRAMSWKSGMQPSELDLTIGVSFSDQQDSEWAIMGMSLK
jgi:hypothetical protein